MRQNISIGFVLLLAVFILFGNCVHAETQSANETQKVPESKPWWWEYSTIASHPRQKSIEEIQGIDADCWRAAGWYAGWFGYFYSDYSIQDTPTLKGWDRVKEAGSKPMMKSVMTASRLSTQV